MVAKKPFGTTKTGIAVFSYTIANSRGIEITVLDYGAAIRSVVLPHKGERTDILLGYDTVEEYERNDGYVGASIGRYAGRIPDSILRIGDDAFPVTANEGKNQLHGGRVGFDKRVWHAETGDDSVTFSLRSEDGDEGFPGTLFAFATYELKEDTLYITYRGRADETTAWNPTNHAYWNLNGHAAGDTRAHRLEIPAERYVPVGPDMIAESGEADVNGSRFDFRAMREIGGAYDHCFELSKGPIRLSGNIGIGLEIETDCRAVQFYNAGNLNERKGKDGKIYRPFDAVCLETEGRQARKNRPVAEENVLPAGGETVRRTAFRFIFQEE